MAVSSSTCPYLQPKLLVNDGLRASALASSMLAAPSVLLQTVLPGPWACLLPCLAYKAHLAAELQIPRLVGDLAPVAGRFRLVLLLIILF